MKKLYDTKCVLDIPDLTLEKGKIYGIVGPSGAGKSTLLYLLNFLLEPDEGQIYYQNNLIKYEEKQLIALRRRMTMVFQKPVLFRGTVFDNLAYGIKIRKENIVKDKIQQVLSLIELPGYENRNAHSLSGGEMQRICLARAVILKPDILLLDEPTSSLDPYNVGVIENLIRYMHECGTTVIMVTHNLFQAKRLADDIIFLWDGSIVELSNSRDFFANPQDERTAAFLNGRSVC